MRERGPIQEFHIRDNTKTVKLIKLRPFECGVGWNMDGGEPRIFPMPLSRWKCGNNLTEIQLSKLEEDYSEWSVDIVCENCKLKGNLCSGMQPIPVMLNIDNVQVRVNKFNAYFNINLIHGKSRVEIDRIINQDTKCKPRFW